MHIRIWIQNYLKKTGLSPKVFTVEDWCLGIDSKLTSPSKEMKLSLCRAKFQSLTLCGSAPSSPNFYAFKLIVLLIILVKLFAN
jgi:hypothetical protein